LGAYVCQELLRTHPDQELILMVRAADTRQAHEKLWRAWQMHTELDVFTEQLKGVRLVFGDLHSPNLGLSESDRQYVVTHADSILHIAASLNRKSSKACLNTNLRGTLSVIKLAQEIDSTTRLRRYAHVSTVAVAGQRDREVVTEDGAIEWNRSDYDPYGRTKKFCEHMARELLPADRLLFFRPSIVMGDSRWPETTQFDMIRAFCVMADLPVVPVRPDVRLDIINADYVGQAIAHIHMLEAPQWDTYHLSAGTSSRTATEIADALIGNNQRRKVRFSHRLERPFSTLVNVLNQAPRSTPVALPAALLKVFLPYITYDTVFDNSRVVTEMDRSPVPFTEYCSDLYDYAKGQQFEYAFVPLPESFQPPTG